MVDVHSQNAQAGRGRRARPDEMVTGHVGGADSTTMRTDITLENTIDRMLVQRGHGSEADIRRIAVSGVVDTDAYLRLPPEVVEVLGLRRQSGTMGPGPVTVRIGDRSRILECSVGRAGSEVLIGHMVLTLLDLVADPETGHLAPRHPDGPVWGLRSVGSIAAMMTRIDVDEGTHARLEALAQQVGLPICDVVRTLSHTSCEGLRRTELRRTMSEHEQRERERHTS